MIDDDRRWWSFWSFWAAQLTWNHCFSEVFNDMEMGETIWYLAYLERAWPSIFVNYMSRLRSTIRWRSDWSVWAIQAIHIPSETYEMGKSKSFSPKSQKSVRKKEPARLGICEWIVTFLYIIPSYWSITNRDLGISSNTMWIQTVTVVIFQQ